MLAWVCGSFGIESVVNGGKPSLGENDTSCSACEMAVVQMQNELKQNQTEERTLNNVNQVMKLIFSVSILLFRDETQVDSSPFCLYHSFAIDCLASGKNQKLTAVRSLPCLLFLSLLEAKHFPSLQSR